MGCWLKWEKGLERKQEILQIAARLLMPPAQAAGTLMVVMSWLDDNVSEYRDGHAIVTLKSLSPAFIDTIAGITGFADALAEVGWIRSEGNNLLFVNAGRHNGVTAKARADASLRKAKSRALQSEDSPELSIEFQRDEIPRKTRRYILERDRFRCVYCGTQSSYQKEYPESSRRGLLSIDHIIPVAKGGSDKVGNLACACLRCNMSKVDRTLAECGFELRYLQPDLRYADGEVQIMSQDRVTELRHFLSSLRSDRKGGGQGEEPTVIPLLLSTDAFAEAWRAWLQHRREIKKPITPGSQTEREQLKTLEAWGEARAIAAIRYTIFKGWQGLREANPNDKEYANHPASSSRGFSQQQSYDGVTEKL